MKTKLLKTIGVMVLVLGVYSFCLAGDKTQDITVKAYIPQQNPAFDLGFYQITPNSTICTGPDSWPEKPSTTPLIDFGTLKWDTDYKIFRGQFYGAVDVGVLDNTNTAWTITHSKKTSLANTTGTGNLDSNVNVVFVKCTGKCKATTEQTQLGSKLPYGNSGKAVTKAQLIGGWLRIYYGVSNGICNDPVRCPNPSGCSVDAPNVEPVKGSQPYGTYQGTVTLTLTP